MKNPNSNRRPIGAAAGENTPKKEIKTIATNKRAGFEYFFIDRYKAGIQQNGTEVKSIRAAKVNMSDAYCLFISGELWVRNLHIAEYRNGTFSNHIPKRDRKLLLQRRELRKLEAKIKERGLTIVPVEVFINERDLIKIEIALSKGKHSYDKRDTIKERDVRRELERERE